ncbi:MAG: group 1 truncated hemoglobin [Candidatus Hydrogenedentes bacterium]|nr:group 1 truncated hemoglobin [Candidatus Hydrogenedentota bacterium]
MESLYYALGGETGLDSLVEAMYRRVLADPELRPFFDGLDMAQQHNKFRAFLQTISGGPVRRSGIELRAAHSASVESGLSERHFDAFVSHLGAALAEAGHGDDIIRTTTGRLNETKADVLGL